MKSAAKLILLLQFLGLFQVVILASDEEVNYALEEYVKHKSPELHDWYIQNGHVLPERLPQRITETLNSVHYSLKSTLTNATFNNYWPNVQIVSVTAFSTDIKISFSPNQTAFVLGTHTTTGNIESVPVNVTDLWSNYYGTLVFVLTFRFALNTDGYLACDRFYSYLEVGQGNFIVNFDGLLDSENELYPEIMAIYGSQLHWLYGPDLVRLRGAQALEEFMCKVFMDTKFQDILNQFPLPTTTAATTQPSTTILTTIATTTLATSTTSAVTNTAPPTTTVTTSQPTTTAASCAETRVFFYLNLVFMALAYISNW